jgi:hypothetical protein
MKLTIQPATLKEVSFVKNYRIVTLVGAVVLLSFCLVPSLGAQDTTGAMQNNNGKMIKDTNSMGHETMSMSHGSTDSGGQMGHMKTGATTHMQHSHMTGGHMMEPGHGGSMAEGRRSGTMKDGSTGEMTH